MRSLQEPVAGMMPFCLEERAYFLIEMMGRYLRLLER